MGKKTTLLMILSFLLLFNTWAFADCGVAPGKVTLSSPAGTVSTVQPVFTWSADNCATWYRIYVWNSSHVEQFSKWYKAQDVTTGTTCSVTLPTIGLARGDYQWYVQTYNSVGYGSWSSGLDFSIESDAARPTLFSPSGTTSTGTTSFNWSKVAGATYYRLWVADTSFSVKYDQWYKSADLAGTTDCSVTLPSGFSSGDYVWYVRTWNSAGYGPWSSGANFTVADAGQSAIREDMTKLLSTFSTGGEMLDPLTDEMGVLLTAAMSGDTSSVPLTITPALETLDFENLPSSITMALNYGNGYAAADGSTMTGSLTVYITGVSVTDQGIALHVQVIADQLKRDGSLVLDGDANLSLDIGIAETSISMNMTANISRMESPAGVTSGQISVSAPNIALDMEDIAFDPVTISFNGFENADMAISAGTLKVSASGTTFRMNADLTTSEGPVKGIIELDASNETEVVLNSNGTLVMGDYVIDINGVAYDPENHCDEYPYRGSVIITSGTEQETLVFTDACTFQYQ